MTTILKSISYIISNYLTNKNYEIENRNEVFRIKNNSPYFQCKKHFYVFDIYIPIIKKN